VERSALQIALLPIFRAVCLAFEQASDFRGCRGEREEATRSARATPPPGVFAALQEICLQVQNSVELARKLH
jgi:hypothetical protein